MRADPAALMPVRPYKFTTSRNGPTPRARKSFHKQQPTDPVGSGAKMAWDITRSRQFHSHAVQGVFINITTSDTPVPQTRLDRRANEGQMS
jgi:hypothetical protein